MRLTLVSPFDPTPPPSADDRAHVGGVERVFANLAPRLASRGHEVRVLCSTDGPGRDDVQAGVTIERVPRAGTVFRAPLVNLAARLAPDDDIVHVAATYPFTTPRMLRKADELGLHSVLDFHFEPRPASWLGRVAAAAYRRLATGSYARADRVLVNSIDYARTAPSLARVPEERWRELPNGIDPDRFHPDGPAHEGDYLLFVGRLVPYKGLQVLLEALDRADIDTPLWIAGEGPRRDELEARAEDVDHETAFLGYVPGEELPALYRGARLTLLPSVNQQEAFGITLVESMACGTPVIASALPGVRQVAREGGAVVDPGDPQAWADRLREATRLDALPRGRELAETIHERYAWEAVTDRLEAVYEEVTGRGQAPPIEAVREERAWTSSP
jgi:glycosyltransferase involved in cell wall biosynthesis